MVNIKSNMLSFQSQNFQPVIPGKAGQQPPGTLYSLWRLNELFVRNRLRFVSCGVACQNRSCQEAQPIVSVFWWPACAKCWIESDVTFASLFYIANFKSCIYRCSSENLRNLAFCFLCNSTKRRRIDTSIRRLVGMRLFIHLPDDLTDNHVSHQYPNFFALAGNNPCHLLDVIRPHYSDSRWLHYHIVFR